MAKATHKWAFKPGMRAGAYSWKSSSKAIERLKSASSEIRTVARVDPVTGAEGVIALAAGPVWSILSLFQHGVHDAADQVGRNT